MQADEIKQIVRDELKTQLTKSLSEQLKDEVLRMVQMEWSRKWKKLLQWLGLGTLAAILSLTAIMIKTARSAAAAIARSEAKTTAQNELKSYNLLLEGISNEVVRLQNDRYRLSTNLAALSVLSSGFPDAIKSLTETNSLIEKRLLNLSRQAEMLEVTNASVGRRLSDITAILEDPKQTNRLLGDLATLRDSPKLQEYANQLAKAVRITTGTVSSTGTTIPEGDFRVERVRVGAYTLTLKEPFSQPPSCVITVLATNQYRGQDGVHPADTTYNVRVSTNQISVWTYTIEDKGKAAASDESFNFILVGK